MRHHPTRGRFRPGVFAFAMALSLSAPLCPEAFAQPSAQEAQAKFEAAQKRYSAADYSGALALFREALATTGSPNARLYVARCLREVGELPQAYAEMRRTARDAAELAAKEKRYQDTQKAAESELAALDARVGRLQVNLPEERPAGIEVRVDGRAVPEEELAEPIPTKPGTITVEVSAPGRTPFSRRVAVAAGSQEKVDVQLETPPPGAPPPPAQPEPNTTSSGGAVRIAGFAVAGVGVVGMVVFAVAGLSAQSQFDDIEEACGGKRCVDEKYNDQIDSGERATTVANVGLVLGAVGLVAGGLMIAFGGPKSARANTGAARAGGVSLVVSPSTVGVRGRF